MNLISTPIQSNNRVCQPNKFRGEVEPIDPDKRRPLWSVLIPTHNCARYLKYTLDSVLRQDRGVDQMEIIVVDDCSTKDKPREVVERVGKGRVRFIQQSENVGKARNYQTGLEASRGQLIHQLHGDDFVCDGFYESMENAFERFSQAGAFFCESEYIDANGGVKGRTGKETEILGMLDNWLDKLVVSQRIQTPSIVVRRDVYEKLGGFDSRLPYFEDWEMWIRIATSYPFGFTPDALAKYRVYSENTSSQSVVSGERVRVLRRAITIADSYLSEDVISRCKAERANATAHYLIRCIPRTVDARKPLAWLKLVWETMRYSVRPRVLYYLFIFTVRYQSFLR